MTRPILHHYDLSPFAEKVRLAFGHKQVAWDSVEVPIWPPRPDMVPLTGGYRRIPALQIGADIYCDTALILSELDRRYPDRALYPAGQVGAVTAFAAWADAAGFVPAATLTTSIIGDNVPAEFIADRIAFMKHDFSLAASRKAAPVNRQRVTALIGILTDMLSDGRPFLFGDTLSAADLAAYHPLWFARGNGGEAIARLIPLEALAPWMDRIAAIGHGERTTMTAAEALAMARHASPDPVEGIAGDDPGGLVAGDAVLVQADQANDPVRGILVAANAREIVVRHDSDVAGTVHVHLPRLGYAVVREGDV